MQFVYKARRNNGTLVEGFIDAMNVLDCKQKLSDQGFFPISVVQTKHNPLMSLNAKLKRKKIKAEELVLFTKQFATLFKAGMGMENILGTLTKQSQNATFKETLESIKQDLQQGSTLAKAFGRHPDIFDELYVNMIASGEEAGILEEVLKQLADMIEKNYTMVKNINSAVFYPKIVIGFLVAAGCVLMMVVVPKFQEIFSQLGADLPLPTKVLIWISEFLQHYFILVVAGAIGLKMLFNRYYKTSKGKMLVDTKVLGMPIFGPLLLKVSNARFASILACLYRSGLPVTKALEITANTISNDAFKREVKLIQSDVEKGQTIADSMRGMTYFDPVLVEATNIGEKSGSLDGMLISMNEHYDLEINHSIKKMTQALEPILLAGIFGMVLVFVLAIFLPIWGMSDAMLK